MAAFTSILIGGLAAGALASTIQQGVLANKAQKNALRAQQAAQKQAETAAIRQQRENEMANNKANAKQPDIAAILAGEQARAARGNSTMLTGPSGVDPGSLKLGRQTLLGE